MQRWFIFDTISKMYLTSFTQQEHDGFRSRQSSWCADKSLAFVFDTEGEACKVHSVAKLDTDCIVKKEYVS